MHYERTNLPADVREVFFSDAYFYASSVERKSLGRPRFVGCGETREEAFADMRQAAAASTHPAPYTLKTIGDRAVLCDEQRQTLAHNLSRLRQALQLSQLQVARQALGFTLSHAAVSRLERAELVKVPVAHLERLAQFYETSLDRLLECQVITSNPN